MQTECNGILKGMYNTPEDELLKLTEDQEKVITKARGAYCTSMFHTALTKIETNSAKVLSIAQTHQYLVGEGGAAGEEFFKSLPACFRSKIEPMLH